MDSPADPGYVGAMSRLNARRTANVGPPNVGPPNVGPPPAGGLSSCAAPRPRAGAGPTWIVVVVALAIVSGSGCSTVMRPTRPDQPAVALGDPQPGLRFDGEETVLREPGMPLSPSRSW